MITYIITKRLLGKEYAMPDSVSSTDIDPKRPSLFRRMLHGVATLALTGLFFAAAGGLVWQGTGVITERAAAVEAPPSTDLIAVQTAVLNLSDHYTVNRAYTGQIEAPQSADLSFEQGGTLEFVGADEGDAVTAGQVIARLDNRLLTADRDRLLASKYAIAAQRDLLALNNERAAQLNERGFASNQSVDQTRFGIVELNARLAEIDASIAALDVRLEKLEIKAPFDGAVNIRHFDPGTTIGGGQPVLSIVADDNPVFRVGVDPQLAGDLTLGTGVNVTIADQSYRANIIAVLPQIDPTTRTRIIRAKLDGATALSFGLTGELTIAQRVETPGAWVPLTAFEDGVRGLWTIKTLSDIDDTARVGVEAVEVIYADAERAYVRGTFEDGAAFIPTGVHRVVAGQNVRITQD